MAISGDEDRPAAGTTRVVMLMPDAALVVVCAACAAWLVPEPHAAAVSAAGSASRPHHARVARRLYSARCDGVRRVTSVVTKIQWLDLGIALGQGEDRMAFSADVPTASGQCGLDRSAGDSAVTRLAETLAVGTRLVNAPLYRLLYAEVSSSHGFTGELGITSFVEYALTLDLAENELVDAISRGRPTSPGTLPLRDRFLPDLAALTDLKRRICVGGPVTLTAIARSDRRWGGTLSDYVLLVQERSGRVLKAPLAAAKQTVEAAPSTIASTEMASNSSDEPRVTPQPELLAGTSGCRPASEPCH